jgi:Na+/H+ antiporter
MKMEDAMLSSTASLHALETMILLLMVMVAVFAVVAHRLRIPYPIVLVIAGLLISFVPHMPRIPLEPSIVFLIFLPPLLYASAWSTSWMVFRHNAVTIVLMAIGLVGFTVWGVAEFSDRFITALDWKAGFLLGAVISTTDAIAATSIAKSIGLPRWIADILEGESLMNDATGLLALEIGLGLLMRGETPTLESGLFRLIYLVVGGVGIGLLIGVVVGWLEKFVDDGPVELVISLVVPYAAYLAGEKAKASGVLAVVACGLYMSRKSATFFSPEVRIQVVGAWNSLNFMLNGMVFMLIGLQLPYVLAGIHGAYTTRTLIFYGVVFTVVLITLRLVWVFPAMKLASFVQRRLPGHSGEEDPGTREIFVVGWTGMRGVLALAAAISIPETLANGQPFGPRNLIVFLTFCVILVTLVLQGLTLPTLIRRLGLSEGTKGMEPEEKSARRIVLSEAMAYLANGRKSESEEFVHAYDDLMHRYRHRLAAVGGGRSEVEFEGMTAESYSKLRSVAEGALQAERTAMIRLREEGKIGDEVLRTMEHELDLAESRYRTTTRWD